MPASPDCAAASISESEERAMSAITNPITATTTPVTSSSSSTTSSSTNDQQMIANNFNTFLQLLTTQLKNQDPLSPMVTNQFTQQLVEFSQVEQQLKTNSSLSTLVTLQQSAQATSALQLVGATVVVNGANAQLTPNGATWTLNATKPANATIS